MKTWFYSDRVCWSSDSPLNSAPRQSAMADFLFGLLRYALRDYSYLNRRRGNPPARHTGSVGAAYAAQAPARCRRIALRTTRSADSGGPVSNMPTRLSVHADSG